MGKHLTNYEQGFIKGLIAAKFSYEDIIVEFKKKFGRKIGHSTITNVQNLSKKKKTKEKRGRPRKTTLDQDKTIIQVIEGNNRKSWAEISHLLKSDYNIDLSPDQIASRAHEYGIKGYKILQKPLLKPEHIEKRLAYANSKSKWEQERWE